MAELDVITYGAAKSYTDKHGGGGGGTSNYNALENKPSIEGNELVGNKTASALGLVAAENGKSLSTNDYDNTEKQKNADNATAVSAIKGDIAPAFDATASYVVGDNVLKDGVLYKCTTDHTGAWDANDFTATTISDEIADVTDDVDGIKDGTNIDSFGDVETALAGKQNTILHGALDASGGENGDLYLKTVSSSNMDVCGTPTANTGDGYEITTDVTPYLTYDAYKAFGTGDGFGKNSQGNANLVYHVTSGKKYRPNTVSLCNNFDVTGGFLSGLGSAYGSTDNLVWDKLFDFNELSTKNESISFDVSTSNFYSYFKFSFTGSGGYAGIKNIVIIGESDSEDDNYIDNVYYKQDGKWLKDAFAKKSELDDKQDKLTFDNAPTENSNNPVKSGGVFTALAGKQATLTFDDAPTDGSNNPVKSNGIYDALALKQDATDNSLDTTAKTIVGAINEHEGDISTLKSGLMNLTDVVISILSSSLKK